MAKRVLTLAVITLVFAATVIFLNQYGPAQRSFASPPAVLLAESTAQIARAWETTGVKGRIAICFTRYLNAVEAKESTDFKVTEISMEKGVLRKVFHIPPDASWPEISGALSKRYDMRPTTDGFVGIFNYGRVYITPLSRFSGVTEKALVIIEPKVWTNRELIQIAEKLKSGDISSDLVIIIRGTEKEADLFRQSLTR